MALRARKVSGAFEKRPPDADLSLKDKVTTFSCHFEKLSCYVIQSLDKFHNILDKHGAGIPSLEPKRNTFFPAYSSGVSIQKQVKRAS